jgi:poly(3-hydroxybutyrate) depolymerase
MNTTHMALVASLLVFGLASAKAQDCNPAPANVATLKEIRPQSFTVEGPLAEFDPCHRSTKFQKPSVFTKSPLMIVLHGGGGLDGATRNAADSFRSKGFASLIFDAYEHNGFNQGIQFWASKGTSEARQRMLYKVALSAYEWALKRSDIDVNQI